jgi:acetoin utilization deacetylase AcuC-like enzyme
VSIEGRHAHGIIFSTVRVFYCDHFVLPLPADHSFPMAKYRLTRERIVAEGIVRAEDVLEAEAVSWAALARVHTAEYIERVRTGTVPREIQRRIGFPWSQAMVERARRSVGATIQAAREALGSPGGVSASLAGGTHHAFADRGEGFCVLDTCRAAAVPVAVTMAGGYAREVEAIVRIHAATIAEAARAWLARPLAEPA